MRAVIWTLLGRHVAFRVTPKSVNALDVRDKLRLLRLPLIIIAVLLGAWFVRTWQQAGGDLPLGVTLPGNLENVAYWVATGFVALEIATVLPAVIRELGRTQHRALWRSAVNLPAQAAGTAVRVRDIHESGASMVGPGGLAEVGDDVCLVISPVPGSDVPPVHATLSVTRVIGHEDNTVYSGTLEWRSDEDRRGMIALCYADLAQLEP